MPAEGRAPPASDLVVYHLCEAHVLFCLYHRIHCHLLKEWLSSIHRNILHISTKHSIVLPFQHDSIVNDCSDTRQWETSCWCAKEEAKVGLCLLQGCSLLIACNLQSFKGPGELILDITNCGFRQGNNWVAHILWWQTFSEGKLLS